MSKSKSINIDRDYTKFLILIFSILFIPSILIFFLLTYPGLLLYDDFNWIAYLNAGHPNGWISIIWQVVAYPMLYLSKNIAIYGVFQLVLVASILTWAIHKLRQLKLLNTKKGMIITTLVFSLSPTYLVFNQILSVDVCFALLLVPLTIYLIEIVQTKGKFFLSRLNITLLSVIMVLIIDFRKNAFLILLAMAIILPIKYSKYWKQILLTVGIVIATTGGISILSKICGVTLSPSQEMLSVPAQQVARVYANKYEIPDDIKQFFNQFHTQEYWETNYNPYLADPMKGDLSLSTEFIVNWLKLGVKYPGTYIKAWVELESPYWSMETSDFSKGSGNSYTESFSLPHGGDINTWGGGCKQYECSKEYLEQNMSPLTSGQSFVINTPGIIGEKLHIPIISDMFKYIFFNQGLPFFLMILISIVAIWKRKIEIFVISIPLWCILLTLILAAPLASFRYSFQVFYIIPILILVIINHKKIVGQHRKSKRRRVSDG